MLFDAGLTPQLKYELMWRELFAKCNEQSDAVLQDAAETSWSSGAHHLFYVMSFTLVAGAAIFIDAFWIYIMIRAPDSSLEAYVQCGGGAGDKPCSPFALSKGTVFTPLAGNLYGFYFIPMITIFSIFFACFIWLLYCHFTTDDMSRKEVPPPTEVQKYMTKLTRGARLEDVSVARGN